MDMQSAGSKTKEGHSTLIEFEPNIFWIKRLDVSNSSSTWRWGKKLFTPHGTAWKLQGKQKKNRSNLINWYVQQLRKNNFDTDFWIGPSASLLASSVGPRKWLQVCQAYFIWFREKDSGCSGVACSDVLVLLQYLLQQAHILNVFQSCVQFNWK